MLAETEAIDAGPFLGVLGQMIMWGGLIICLAMVKNYVTAGTSAVAAEFLFKAPEKVQSWACTYIVNGDLILAELKKIKKRNGAE